MAYVNDNFADATPVTGLSGSITPFQYDGTATQEPNEWTGRAGETMWWSWQCPSDGTYYFSTEGSTSDLYGHNQLDTILQVFGTPDPTIRPVAYNDDSPVSNSGVTSLASFDAVTGQTYYVQVDFYDNAERGMVSLSWGPYAALDPFSTIMFVDHQIGALGDAFVCDGSSSVGIATWHYEVQDYLTNAVLARSPDGTGTPTPWTYQDASASFTQAWAYLFTTAPDGRGGSDHSLLTIGTPPPLGMTTLTAVLDPTNPRGAVLDYTTPSGAPYRLDLQRKVGTAGTWAFLKTISEAPGPHEVTDFGSSYDTYSYRLYGYNNTGEGVCSNEASILFVPPPAAPTATNLLILSGPSNRRLTDAGVQLLDLDVASRATASYSATLDVWVVASAADLFSRSTDKGANWAPAKTVYRQGIDPYYNTDTYWVRSANNGPVFLLQETSEPRMARSTDGGVTWTATRAAPPPAVIPGGGSPPEDWSATSADLVWTGTKFATIFLNYPWVGTYDDERLVSLYSADGQTWTTRQLPALPSLQHYDLPYYQRALVLGDTILRTIHVVPHTLTNYNPSYGTYISTGLLREGPSSTTYEPWTHGGLLRQVIQGPGGLLAFTDSSDPYINTDPVVRKMWRSTDSGVTWSEMAYTLPADADPSFGVDSYYDGKTLYLGYQRPNVDAYTGSYALLSTGDAQTWTQIAAFTGQNLYGVCLSGGPAIQVPETTTPFNYDVVPGGDLKRIRFIRQR